VVTPAEFCADFDYPGFIGIVSKNRRLMEHFDAGICRIDQPDFLWIKSITNQIKIAICCRNLHLFKEQLFFHLFGRILPLLLIVDGGSNGRCLPGLDKILI
jgi:hypothetical protein